MSNRLYKLIKWCAEREIPQSEVVELAVDIFDIPKDSEEQIVKTVASFYAEVLEYNDLLNSKKILESR